MTGCKPKVGSLPDAEFASLASTSRRSMVRVRPAATRSASVSANKLAGGDSSSDHFWSSSHACKLSTTAGGKAQLAIWSRKEAIPAWRLRELQHDVIPVLAGLCLSSRQTLQAIRRANICENPQQLLLEPAAELHERVRQRHQLMFSYCAPKVACTG